MQIKKEYVAIPVGFVLFIVLFLAAALLDSAGHKHQSRILVFAAMTVLGATMLIGLYSNVKNFGYIWTNVRREDGALPFAALDEKYRRTGKGTWQYRVAVWGMGLVAAGVCIGGVALLLNEVFKK